eukprot:13588774-Ditylum_brightwellii.AAC.1
MVPLSYKAPPLTLLLQESRVIYQIKGEVEKRWGSLIDPPEVNTPDNWDPYEEYEVEDEEVQLQDQDNLTTYEVGWRALGHNSKIVGSYHDNPIPNSKVYEVEFPDGKVKEYAANVIADIMLTQVDFEGFNTTMVEGIINHTKDKPHPKVKGDYKSQQQGGIYKSNGRKSQSLWFIART